MSIEIEKRFRNFDYELLKKKLAAKGYKPRGFLFRIVSYLKTEPQQVLVRLRDEGHRITFTIKEENMDSYEKEFEIKVDSFDMARLILNKLGLKENYTLEKYREIYDMPDYKTELVFDHYPGCPAYMEIESETELDIQRVCELLDMDFNEPQKWSAGDLYLEHYGIPLKRPLLPLDFANVKQYFTPLITKNLKKFEKLLGWQMKNLLVKSDKNTKQTRKTKKH